MKQTKYSAIVIGSGIAGLYSALKIEQQLNLPDGVLLVTKSKLGESNSYYAQGGMVAVLKDNKNDSVESHISDTIKAGAGLSELETIKFILLTMLLRMIAESCFLRSMLQTIKFLPF